MSVLIQRLKQPVVRVLAAFTGPRIVYGWRNADGTWCPHTRVSTHSCVEGRDKLVLQDHVFIGHFNRIDGSNGLLIEEGVQVTNYASILSHSSHQAVRVMGRRTVPDFAIVATREQGKRAEVVGDTREMDRALLERHPELQALYAQWAGKDHLRRALNGGGKASAAQKGAA